jgi:cation diffusion facilitator CzcD-associated flavoprotein CzcO
VQPAERAGAARGRCLPRIAQFTTFDYRRPGDLPDGGVLVVGPSATGLQLASEIHQSGPPRHHLGR